MPTPSLPFFHPTVLSERFTEQVANLLRSGDLSPRQASELTLLTEQRHDPALGRKDWFVPAPGTTLAPVLQGALVLGLPRSARVYLLSLTHDLECFASRQLMTQALNARGIDTTGLALELVDGLAFEAQAEHYLLHRATGLAQAADALTTLPMLELNAGAGEDEPSAALLKALDLFWEAGPHQHPHQRLLQHVYAAGFWQALLEARDNVPLPSDRRLLLSDPLALNVKWARLCVQDGAEQAPLAGVLAWSLSDQPERGLYRPDIGVTWYPDEATLLRDQAAQASPPISLSATLQERWRHERTLNLVAVALEGDPFHQAIEEIRATQNVDVYDALLKHHALDPSLLMIHVENALDVRARLDRRLSSLDRGARWVNLKVSALASAPDPKALPERTGEILAGLAQLSDCRLAMALAQPRVARVLDSLLLPWLVVFDPHLTPERLNVTFDDAQSVRTLSLDELLLSRLSSQLEGPMAPTTVVEIANDRLLEGFSPRSLETCLVQATTGFKEQYQAQLDRLYHHGHRVNGRWVETRQVMNQTLEWVLRADLALAARDAVVPANVLSLLQASLDGGSGVEAFGIDLTISGQGAVRLADVAVLQLKPATSQASKPGPLLFWSAALGVRSVSSRAQLSAQLIEQLSKNELGNPWLHLLPSVDEALLQVLHNPTTPAQITPSYWAMDGSLIHRLYKSAHGRRLDQSLKLIQLMQKSQSHPVTLRVLLDSVALSDTLAKAINRLALGWVNHQATAVLPTWVRTAPLDEQRTFIAYLRDCARVASPEADYLQGLPTLEDFALRQVREKMAADGFDASVDPRHVRITSRAYVPAPVTIGSLPSAIPAAVRIHEQSLSEAALQPNAWLRESMTLSRDDGGAIPAQLTPSYIRTLVQALDCGGRYRQLLSDTLSLDNPSASARRERFTWQMRRQMLMTGFALKLQGKLSAQGFGLIERLAQTPDAQARRDAGLDEVMLSLVQVRALPGQSADTCQGVYTLEQPDTDGPVVMFMLYAQGAAFVEYSSQTGFKRLLETDSALQAVLLERIDPLRRPIYAEGGFHRPHINRLLPETVSDVISTVAPAQWLTPAVAGNAFHRLYEDNLALLISMAKAQTVSAQEARWQDLRYLIGLAVEQGSMFLPIPFAAVIGLWQSGQLAGAAWAAARHRKWGQALSEMVAAMTNLLTLASPAGPVSQDNQIFAWSLSSALPTELRQRLTALEVNDQDLAQLTPLPSLPLYESEGAQYASVEGKVFRVGQQAGQWHILDRDNRGGPRITLGSNNRWRLDLGLRGGGPILSRYRREMVLESLSGQFVVTETGMREIRRFKPTHAIQLERSLIQAQRLLYQAERKLRDPTTISAHTRAVLEDTFGPGQATPALVGQLRQVMETIYAEAVSTSLRDGERWVLCTPTPGNELNVAFIIATDPGRRIFLSDSFFEASTVTAVSAQALREGFDPLRYLQSTVLIHELSHWSLRTDDFSYLGLETPYFDLVEPMIWQAHQVQIEAERRRLSYDTPAGRLFTTFRANQLHAADRATLKRLLKLTKQTTLAGAVYAYQTNPAVRNKVILSNADSITWLTLQLGRDADPVVETWV